MRIPLMITVFLLAAVVGSAAAGDSIELYNIGISVSMENERTTISLFLDGLVEPVQIDSPGEGVLVFELKGVELTAADEGVTSFAVFSPSVASIKLTQIATDPYKTRFEIYINGQRDYIIQRVSTGVDFIVYPAGDSPEPEEEIEEPVEDEPVAEVEEPAEEEPVEEEVVEEEVVEEPIEEIIEETPEEIEIVQPRGSDPLGYRPIPRDEWYGGTRETGEPVYIPVIEEPEPEEVVKPVEVVPVVPVVEPEEEAIEEPVEEEIEEPGMNLLQGINLLVVEEEPVEEEVEIIETGVQEEAIIEVLPSTDGAVKLDNLNFQAGDSSTDLLVFTMVGNYPGEVRTNLIHKKGFVVLSHCNVSHFVEPGEFKTVEISGKHIRYVIININDDGEAVFTLILTDPEADYALASVIKDEMVKVSIALAE